MIYNKKKVSYVILFVLYCLIMAYLLFGRNIQANPTFNIIPFFTIKEFFELIKNPDNSLRMFSVINLIGNIVMFIPLGLFPPAVSKKLKSLPAILIFSSVTIIAVETLQFFTARGIADIDDFILNTLGVLIGYFLYNNYLQYVI